MDNDNKLLIDRVLLDIEELLKNGAVNETYRKYNELIKRLENKEYAAENHLKARVYSSCAYFLFGISEYDYCFKMFIKAQECGYSKGEIEKFLFEAFIEPNLDEFKSIYETNMKFLISNNYLHIDKEIAFQELPFYLLPTGVQDQYYMYDKEEQLIKEKISLYDYQEILSLPTSDSFADYLVIEDSNWNSILTCTNVTRKINKKTYILIDNLSKFFSWLQGSLLNHAVLSNVVIFDDRHSMNDYFKGVQTFLPRNIINLTEDSERTQHIFEEAHNYRLHKENRKGDQIILSICIPSFNRGNRAYENVKHLLTSYYDEEIEIIVSNNGTQNATKEDYEKIRDIDDARLTYFAFEENQGFAINCCKVSELAKGQFILLISDEDFVNFNVLSSILSMLDKEKDSLSLLKASSTFQAKHANKTGAAGKEALLSFMLTSNYMSGLIIKNKLLQQHRGIEYVKENLDNSVCFHYPHMFWEILLCQYGDVRSTDLTLIQEGIAEKTDVEEIQIGSELRIPSYSTIEERLRQHEGFTTIIKYLEINKENTEFMRKMYLQICSKTLFLTTVAINVFYKKTDANFQQLYTKAFDFVSNEKFYFNNVSSNPNNYLSDLKEIERLYNYFIKKI